MAFKDKTAFIHTLLSFHMLSLPPSPLCPLTLSCLFLSPSLWFLLPSVRRLYSCLANGSPDEFQRGEQLYRIRAVKDPLQIGEQETHVDTCTHQIGEQWAEDKTTTSKTLLKLRSRKRIQPLGRPPHYAVFVCVHRTKQSRRNSAPCEISDGMLFFQNQRRDVSVGV